MGNIVSITKATRGCNDSFLGSYIEAQNKQGILEEVFFVAGVILTVGLPEFFFIFYGGLIPFFVLAGSLLAGAGLGFAIYTFRSPYQTLSLSNGILPQVTPSKPDAKKAA